MCRCLCAECKKPFSRPLKEVIRSMKKAGPLFCSRSCSGKQNTGHMSANLNNLVHDNRRDEYTPFREVFRRCKRRDKDFDLDLQYLKEQWEKQQGTCPYLKIKLVLPATNGKQDSSNPNYVASVDRIDSRFGYIKGNVQFISLTVNYAKNNFDEAVVTDLINLCKLT